MPVSGFCNGEAKPVGRSVPDVCDGAGTTPIRVAHRNVLKGIPMAKIEASIDVDVPVRVAYDQWTQFEEFPRFMDAVESVEQVDDTHLRWVATIAGVRKEWDAEITQQEPDQRVAWAATSGAENAGAVDFHRLDDRSTRITLTMDVDPEGLVENVGNAIGVPERQVEGDLKRFKEYIEQRGVASGAWRGSVEQDDVSG
jgi:uncharacterized membrane protein